MKASMRDHKIDVYKGLLVFGMIYCHVLQFFTELGGQTPREYMTWYINAVTFSGFVFTFGYSSQIAYFSKQWKKIWLKMAVTGLKLLMAFYVSGIAFRVFVSNYRLSWGMVKGILLLKDIPGWSEFILSFGLYMVIGLIFFIPLKWLLERKWLFWSITGALLLTTYIPYDSVESIRWGLLIGTTRFAAFPVVQYMPFFLIGMYFKRYDVGFNGLILAVASLLSSVGVVYIAMNGTLPGRFPPSLEWIVLPVVILYLYFLFSNWMKDLPGISHYLMVMGQHSLMFLLISNILIFALDGTKALPLLNELESLVFHLLLLFVIQYMVFLIRPGRGRHKANQEGVR